jgi:hypothetical protein
MINNRFVERSFTRSTNSHDFTTPLKRDTFYNEQVYGDPESRNQFTNINTAGSLPNLQRSSGQGHQRNRHDNFDIQKSAVSQKGIRKSVGEQVLETPYKNNDEA